MGLVVAADGLCTTAPRPGTIAGLQALVGSALPPKVAVFSRGHLKGIYAVCYDEEGPYSSQTSVAASQFVRAHVDVPTGHVHGTVVFIHADYHETDLTQWLQNSVL